MIGGIMKKFIAILQLLIVCILLVACSADNDIAGFYDVEGRSSVYEFTSDGRIIENGNTVNVSNYRIENDEIIIYIEGVPESEFPFPFRKEGDNFFMGELEYRRLKDINIDTEETK